MTDKSIIAEITQKLIARGQLDKAIAEWEKIPNDARDGHIYNILGDLYLKKNAKNDAIAAFLKAGNWFREDGFYLKAIAIFKKIINISAFEPEALISLAELNAEKGLISDANEYFLRAIEIYSREGMPEKVMEAYRKMLRFNPSDIDIKLKIIELNLKVGAKEEAIKEYLSIASDSLEKGEFEKAEELYNRVLHLEPQNVDSLIGLGRITEERNDINQAYEHLSNARAFAPDNPHVLFNYVRVAMKMDYIDNAKHALTRLIEINPFNNQYKDLLGEISLKEGLPEEIKSKIFEETLSETPFSAEKEFKESNEAKASEAITSADEKYLNAKFALAETYEKNNEYDNAFRIYMEIHAQAPNFKDVSRKIDNIKQYISGSKSKPKKDRVSYI